MENETIVFVDFQGHQVKKRISDGFVNVTDFLAEHNATSNKPKKVFAEFWSNNGTKSTYSYLLGKTGEKILHEAKKGKGGATWMHEELFIIFFNWCKSIPNMSITRDEHHFCLYIEEALEGYLSFERQKRFDNYFVDLFCEELSLCIEFDENHHTKESNSILDIDRQKHIEDNHNVIFIRHKKGDNFSKTINNILRLKESFNIVGCIKNNKMPKSFFGDWGMKVKKGETI